MVKKSLRTGKPCQKCLQAEELLRRKGLWTRIDEVLWAVEDDPSSAGMQLAVQHQVDLAPFFLVENHGTQKLYTSVLRLISEVLSFAESDRARTASDTAPMEGKPEASSLDLARLAQETQGLDPEAIVAHALKLFGSDCVLAFSGAEDVALIQMAVRSGHPFRVLTLDTGRLHPETYRFIETVRTHFGIEIPMTFPDAGAVESLVRNKGLFSFYSDGHTECCAIRKVRPLKRGLLGFRAWMTGQRRDQSPTRATVPLVQVDQSHSGRSGPLLKWNPLANWTLAEVWQYIRGQGLPYNPLHDQGFVSIGCEPCTRAVRPGEHERAGRWWWEESTKRECGLHVRS